MKKIFILLGISITTLAGNAQQLRKFVPCNDMPLLISSYFTDIRALNRVYVVTSSPEYNSRYKQLALDYINKLKDLQFNALNIDCKADYVLFQQTLENNVYERNESENDFKALQNWFPFASDIYEIEKLRRRGGSIDGQQVAGKYANILQLLKQLTANIESEKNISVNHARAAKSIIRGMQSGMRNVFRFYNGYDPLFTWWVPDLHKQLDSALTNYGNAFTKQADKHADKKDASGIIGFPIGRQELIRQLQNELINYTPEELIAIANKEFAWCDKELLKASAEMGFGNDWKKAQEKVKQAYVPPGKQAEEMMKLYNESIDFLKKNDLITIPPLAEETWRVVMMTPEQQLVNPFFYGGEEFAVSYPTNTMQYDARLMSMRGNNPHFSRATVHHELIAGHYLQQFMNERYYSYRRSGTPFWTEGWALYWELLLWDMNFARSPEDRIGMLFWRMHRCARIIFSLNYHLGKWTPQECINFLVDRVGHERANAEGEVRRSFTGGYSPLYQVAYMIGGLQFMALKNEALQKGMTIKQFHDAVMVQNAMSVEMLRNILLNLPISQNYKTNWRFYKLP